MDFIERVNVIGLYTRYETLSWDPLMPNTQGEQRLALSDSIMGSSSTWEGD